MTDTDKRNDQFLASLNGPECRAWIATLLVLRSLPEKCRCIREHNERRAEKARDIEDVLRRRSA